MKVQTLEFDLRVGLDQINGTHHPQEDSYDCGETPYGYYYVLADGMGGYGGGDVSSQAVVAAFSECMKKGDSPETALSRANEALAKVKKRKNLPPEAGCTLVAVTVDITKDGVFCSFLSVGDSYIYYFPADAPMRQVNPLHENEDGSLYSALQGGEIEEVYTEVNALELYPGDRLMLASDGIQAFGENKLRSLFRKYPVPPMQHHHEDVIPGEAGDMVYRILHQLEEETEQGLQNDPEYYQDNTSVMIVEWPPAAQKSQGKAIAVKSKSRIILSRDRMLMAGVIVVLALALCFALFLNSGEVSKIVQNSAPVSQTAPQPQPANHQREETVGAAVELPDEVKTFVNKLKAGKVNYVSIVEAWAGLKDGQKEGVLGDLKEWFYGKEGFDRLMERCQGLADIDKNKISQADGMLAYLLEKDVDAIEGILPTSITKNKLNLNPIKGAIPHFLLLDLLLATKADVKEKDWLNWFIYEFALTDENLKSKKEKWQNEVREKALNVDPDKLLDAFNKQKSASKSNVDALLEDIFFVEGYSENWKEWIKQNYKKDDRQDFCKPLLCCLITKNVNDGVALSSLDLTVADLEELNNGGKFVTAIKNLALAKLVAKLDALTTNVSADALGEVEKAYNVAEEYEVADRDDKVSAKVAELIKNKEFRDEIYKGDRYLKPIWTKSLIALVSENKEKAEPLESLDLDVDKICKLLNQQGNNEGLKGALKTLIKRQMMKAGYDVFKTLHSVAQEKIDGGFAADLVWQFFTTEEKLNAAKVTEYAKDGERNPDLMNVLVATLIEKKTSGGTADIKSTDLMDYKDVQWDDFDTTWGENPPTSWLLYRYILYMIPSDRLGEIEKEDKQVNKDDNLKKLSDEIHKAANDYVEFIKRLTDQNQ